MIRTVRLYTDPPVPPHPLKNSTTNAHKGKGTHSPLDRISQYIICFLC